MPDSELKLPALPENLSVLPPEEFDNLWEKFIDIGRAVRESVDKILKECSRRFNANLKAHGVNYCRGEISTSGNPWTLGFKIVPEEGAKVTIEQLRKDLPEVNFEERDYGERGIYALIRRRTL